MKNCVFTLYNNLSCRYGDVMSYPTEGFAQKVLSTQLPKMNMDLSEYELCRIGDIDVLTGVIEPCAVKRIPWNSVQPLEQKAE